ncbi:sugar phosphate isomerase/epimerase family protein [Rubritalea marina]|uniref:sugar phosphate isomerase/epimerase family protein n=1 Tax=Rubritalea marina TaxID=361055 RepID=UPI00146167CD|nr:TIM barrel protein [Rubritalea marina]
MVSAIAEAPAYSPKFYAFYNALGFADMDTEAKALKELGYAGVSVVLGDGYGKLPKLVEVYERHGLEVLSLYLNVDEKPLPEAFLAHLKQRNALAEVTVTKKGPNTVAALKQSADMAQKLGVKLTLYPHAGFSVATMQDALDLIDEVDHPNLGVSFNLAHFLKVEDVATLEEVIRQSAPHLFCVNTNGANVGGKSWDELIMRLGEGDFPQEQLLRVLQEVGYQGPVGMQCFGVKGDKLGNLRLSIEAWNAARQSL